jgi:gluconokinase
MNTSKKQPADYIIGADIGTSSSKALAYSLKGEILCQHQITCTTKHPRPSFSEQDPDEILKAVTGAIHAVVKEMKGRNPRCVSFSSAMHSLMAVNGKGEPLSPLIIWSDGRSQKEAEKLKAQKAATAIYTHTGTPIHPMSPLCKLLWWKEENRKSFKEASRFIGIKGYVFSQLFGEYPIDYSLASATGLFDHTALRWYDPALDLIGIKKERLADPVSPLQLFKGLKKDYAKQMGLEPDTPFVPGAGDGCLANLGTGVTMKGELAATIGTSGAVRLFIDKPITDKKQRLFNYLLLEKEFISGGAINNGGVMLDWFRTHFMKEGGGQTSYDDFVHEAMGSEAGSRGLLFLPYLLGERAPMWDARARGAFIGIHYKHERKHFMRAVLEGICFSLFDSVRILETPKRPISNVYVSGGFTRSPAWVQMLTDTFNKEVKVSGRGDASSVGAALLGMRALGIISSWDQADKFIPVTKTFTPRKKEADLYHRNFEVFSRMYETLMPTMHEIAGWQHER